jgi:hypothetical protein
MRVGVVKRCPASSIEIKGFGTEQTQTVAASGSSWNSARPPASYRPIKGWWLARIPVGWAGPPKTMAMCGTSAAGYVLPFSLAV